MKGLWIVQLDASTFQFKNNSISSSGTIRSPVLNDLFNACNLKHEMDCRRRKGIPIQICLSEKLKVISADKIPKTSMLTKSNIHFFVILLIVDAEYRSNL